MSDEEHADAPEDTGSDEQQDGTRKEEQRLAENAGDAFRELYEPGPRIHTSSRPLDEPISDDGTDGADDKEPSSDDGTDKANDKEPTTQQSVAATDDSELTGTGPSRTVVSDRSVDDVLTSLDEQQPSEDPEETSAKTEQPDESVPRATGDEMPESTDSDADHGPATETNEKQSQPVTADEEADERDSESTASDQVDADHTRSLDGEPAETTPVSELDLSVDDLEGPPANGASTAGTETSNSGSTGGTADEENTESDSLLSRLKSLLFDW